MDLLPSIHVDLAKIPQLWGSTVNPFQSSGWSNEGVLGFLSNDAVSILVPSYQGGRSMQARWLKVRCVLPPAKAPAAPHEASDLKRLELKPSDPDLSNACLAFSWGPPDSRQFSVLLTDRSVLVCRWDDIARKSQVEYTEESTNVKTIVDFFGTSLLVRLPPQSAQYIYWLGGIAITGLNDELSLWTFPYNAHSRHYSAHRLQTLNLSRSIPVSLQRHTHSADISCICSLKKTSGRNPSLAGRVSTFTVAVTMTNGSLLVADIVCNNEQGHLQLTVEIQHRAHLPLNAPTECMVSQNGQYLIGVAGYQLFTVELSALTDSPATNTHGTAVTPSIYDSLHENNITGLVDFPIDDARSNLLGSFSGGAQTFTQRVSVLTSSLDGKVKRWSISAVANSAITDEAVPRMDLVDIPVQSRYPVNGICIDKLQIGLTYFELISTKHKSCRETQLVSLQRSEHSNLVLSSSCLIPHDCLKSSATCTAFFERLISECIIDDAVTERSLAQAVVFLLTHWIHTFQYDPAEVLQAGITVPSMSEVLAPQAQTLSPAAVGDNDCGAGGTSQSKIVRKGAAKKKAGGKATTIDSDSDDVDSDDDNESPGDDDDVSDDDSDAEITNAGKKRAKASSHRAKRITPAKKSSNSNRSSSAKADKAVSPTAGVRTWKKKKSRALRIPFAVANAINAKWARTFGNMLHQKVYVLGTYFLLAGEHAAMGIHHLLPQAGGATEISFPHLRFCPQESNDIAAKMKLWQLVYGVVYGLYIQHAVDLPPDMKEVLGAIRSAMTRARSTVVLLNAATIAVSRSASMTAVDVAILAHHIKVLTTTTLTTAPQLLQLIAKVTKHYPAIKLAATTALLDVCPSCQCSLPFETQSNEEPSSTWCGACQAGMSRCCVTYQVLDLLGRPAPKACPLCHSVYGGGEGFAIPTVCEGMSGGHGKYCAYCTRLLTTAL